MALKLEVFETEVDNRGKSTVVLDAMLLEETKLASYDSGYRAGWDDAVSAQSSDQTQIRMDLARNLQQLGFTFQEARMHVLQAIEPLLNEMVGRLLPELVRETLAPIVLEELMPMAENMADAPVTIVINPNSRQAVEGLLEQATGLPLAIVEEPSLSDGQVYLKMGNIEAQVNLDRAIAEITAAVRGFFELPEKETANG